MYQCSLLILTLQNPHVQPHRFSHNTRHLKFPAGEFPAARSDMSKKELQTRSRSRTRARTHTRLTGVSSEPRGFGPARLMGFHL